MIEPHAGQWPFALIGAAVAVAVLARPSPDMERVASAAAQRPFVVYDGTLYKGKPFFAPLPFRSVTVLYEARLFEPGQPATAMVREPIVRQAFSGLRAAREPVVIDIERWPLKGDAKMVRDTVGRLLTVLSWARSEAPGVRLGFYGTVPIPDYWRAVRGPESEEFRSWQRDNDRLGVVSERVDALFPSIYTFYPDRQGWVTYAQAQIAEARRMAKGKPVYAFLWPHYHESNILLGGRPIEPDYWELQLNTAYRHADGVVIWGGWGKGGPDVWNDDAPWWRKTKDFLRRIDPSATPPSESTAP